MMQKTRYGGALLLAAAVAVAACYPGDPTDISDFDTVTTLFDGGADWGSFQTYVLPDTIIHVVAEDQDSLPISRAYDQDILDLVRLRIEDYGYVAQANPETNPADVVFLVSVAASENWYGWISDPCGPWGWWPGWGPYPPWGGCWYPPSIGVARVNTGTLFVEMVDPNSPVVEQDSVIPIYWTAAMNGLLGGSAASAASRLNTNINQAFDQSPYLQVNQPTQ